MADSTSSPAAARRTLKRTKRMKSAERRLQLLDVARSVFAQAGYYGASMDDVATAAGVTKPVLYQHFESKKELYLALIDEASLGIAKAVWEATSGRETPWEATVEGMRAYFDYVSNHQDSFRILFSDAQADTDIRDRVDSIRILISERVSQLLGVSEMAQWANQDQLDIAATGIVGMAEMVGRHWIESGRASVDDAAVTLADFVYGGFSGSPVGRNEQPAGRAGSD